MSRITVWFRKEPSRKGRSGKMLEATLLQYTYLSSVIEWRREIVLEIALTLIAGFERN